MRVQEMTQIKLNLGCGSDYRSGYINADRMPGNVDVLFDLNTPPYPFPANSVSEILMQHVLEHMHHIKPVMDELWRILRSNGKLTIRVPHFTHFQATTHPEHYHAFHYRSLSMFTLQAGEPYTNCLWDMEKSELHFDRGLQVLQNFFNSHKYVYTTTILAYLFPAYEVEFLLRPVKQLTDESRESLGI